MEMVSVTKRTNKARFTSEEVEVLITEIEKRSKLLFGKLSGGGGTNTRKINAWNEIAAAVNAVSAGPVRTVAEIKLKWKDHKRLAKSKLVENRREVAKTGGGPGPENVDPFLERMAALTGEASISGIPGGGMEFGFGEPMEDAPVAVVRPKAEMPHVRVPTVIGLGLVEQMAQELVPILQAQPMLQPMAQPILQDMASQTTMTGNDYMAAHLAQGERLIMIHTEQTQAMNRLASVLEMLVRSIVGQSNSQ